MTEYFFKEGCYIEELMNENNQPNMSIARVRVLKNITTQLHALHATTERYVILSGEGRVTVAEQSRPVSANDIVTIEPEQAQKIENTGQEDLVFLAICTPRFLEKNYFEITEVIG